MANSEGNADVEDGGVWNVNGNLVIGDHGIGFVYLRQDGAISLASGKQVLLGNSTDGKGVLNLYGNGALTVDSNVVVGQNGTGVFTLNNSASYTSVGNFLLGNFSTANGDIDINTGSTFTVNGDLTVGVAGIGTMNVDSTSKLDVSTGSLTLGLIDGSFGQLVVNGGQLLRPTSGFTTIGFSGRGILEISGGSHVTDSTVRIAQNPSTSVDPSALIVDGAGTLLTISTSIDVGIEAAGSLTVQNGGHANVAGYVAAASGTTGTGSISVSGTGSKLMVTGPFILGEAGTSFGFVDQNAALETGLGTIGHQLGSQGTIDISAGGTWTVHGNLIVGDEGGGFVYLREGGAISVDSGSQVILGNSPDGSGIFNLFGNGSLTIHSDVVIGQEGAGAFNLFSGATYTSFGNIALGMNPGSSGGIGVNSGSSFTVNGILTLAEKFSASAGLAVDGVGSVLSASSIHVGGSQGAPGGLATVDVTNQGRIQVAQTLNVWGGGTVRLMTGGGITVGANSPAAADGELRVNAQGLLSGSGTIIGNVLNAAGTVAPGNSPGILSVTGNYTQSSAGTLQIELGGTTPGSGFDQLLVTGGMSLAGTLNVSLTNGFLPKKNDSFDILDWGSAGLTGTFTTVHTPNMNGRIVWDLSHLYDSGALGGTISVAATYYLGDLDRNSQITVADISALMAALSNLNGYRSANGLSDPTLFDDVADVNGDGKVNNLDIQSLISLVANLATGSPAPGSIPGNVSSASAVSAVPEPHSVVLFVFGISVLAGMLRRQQPS